MHGVRLAVACGVHCEHCNGCLMFVVFELRQYAHTRLFQVVRCRGGHQREQRLQGYEKGLGAYYKAAVWGQQSSAKVTERRVTHQAAKVALEFGVVPSCTHSECVSFSDWRPPHEWGVGCIQLYTSMHAKHRCSALKSELWRTTSWMISTRLRPPRKWGV